MARVCQVTGKGPMVGNNVSHANNKTKRRFLPNLQNRRIFVESANRWVSLRVSIYHDAQANVRVQVTFIPQANGAISVCYAVTSVGADGSRYLTDNLYIPFAGFYPENWFVERAPWRRSLPRLLALIFQL